MLMQHWLMLLVVFVVAWYLAKNSGIALPLLG